MCVNNFTQLFLFLCPDDLSCGSPFACAYFMFQVYAAYFMMCYFQGGKIRGKLVAGLSAAEDVVIEEGTAGEGGKAAAQNGMRK
jgi:hypothetical protein